MGERTGVTPPAAILDLRTIFLKAAPRRLLELSRPFYGGKL